MKLASQLAPLNPRAPYSPLFQKFGQKRKILAEPTFRPEGPRRNVSAAQRKLPALRTRRRSPARAPATGRRARAQSSGAPDGRPRARTNSAQRRFASARTSLAPKKKNQSSRRPLLAAAVKGGQKPQPPPIRGPKFHPVPAPPAHMLKLSSNERV